MCHFPINIKNPKKRLNVDDYQRINVPCGKCNLCLKKRADNWLLRLQYELKTATHAYFVTLTYEETPRTKNGLRTAQKSHLQDYFKRLRKREGNNTYIKYYASCEYGKERHRPHYHIILFNVYDKINIYKAWSNKGKYMGTIEVEDEVNDARMRYVTGYIEKKVGIGTYDHDDRQKEFSLMSKNLGKHFLDVATLFHTTTQQGYTQLGKRKYCLPRYYKEKIFPDHKTQFKFGEIQFTVKSPNLIKKQISKNNYENYLQSEIRRISHFNSLEDFDKNRKALAERDNPTLQHLLITPKSQRKCNSEINLNYDQNLILV